MAKRSARGNRSASRLPSFLNRLGTPLGFAVAAVLVILLALGARLATWEWIFGHGRVELIPSDSHYYVRLARLHLAAGGPVAFDPFVGFPRVATNDWPPFHILLVTVAVALAPDPELGAAFVGPAATLLWLIAVAWVGYRAVGRGPTLFCLFVLALTPILIEAGKVGNADHNVHEAPLAAIVVLLTILAIRGSSAAAVGAGVVAGAARLFTTVGFVLPVLVAAGLGATVLARNPAERRNLLGAVVRAGAACAGTLLLAVFVLGSPRGLEYEALTLFHPLLACALFGLAAAWCGWSDRRPAVAWAGLATGLAGVVLVPQLMRAASHLGRSDPMLAVVAESRPLIADPVLALALLGPALIALPLAWAGAYRAWMRHRLTGAAPALVATLLFLLGAGFQARFAPLLGGAASVLIPLGLGSLIGGLSPGRARWALATTGAGFGVLLLLLIPPPPPAAPSWAEQIRPTLFWMRDNLPPAVLDPYAPGAVPSYGVLAPYDYGHFVTLYAERPVLASPFSQTDAHVESNRAATEILEDADEERAFRRARELGLAYVLAAPSALFDAETPSPDALLSRLLRRDSFARFRPLFVSAERNAGGGRYATVFEIVEGAVLTGSAAPGVRVEARLDDGYARAATADGSGRFAIRVARPGEFQIRGGDASGLWSLSESDVRGGASVVVELRTP